MDFELLFEPVEQLDAWLADLFAVAPLAVALVVAFLLGLRHASDPDHLVAVTSLIAADRGDTGAAARLGAWWGLGHAGVLVALGLPLILLKSSMPPWLESGAEKGVGVVIILLAMRVIWRWARGGYRASPHDHEDSAATDVTHPRANRHLRRDAGSEHRHLRTPRQAFGIGVLHGLAGTGAVVLLLIAALPSRLEAAAALMVFAPMSIASMAMCTTAFAWILTRPVIEPVYRLALVPGLGVFGLMFGLWYAGLA